MARWTFRTFALLLASCDDSPGGVRPPAFDAAIVLDAPVDMALWDEASPDLGGPDRLRPPKQWFAVIGDYGADDPDELHVAQLVKSWAPEFIVTLGDNNYPNGEASTIDRNVGKYYSDFIGGYIGLYGPGSKTNRFWPAIGNHEWYNPNGVAPYLAYFNQLPGNGRYYEERIGLVDLFIVDSDMHEPDGMTADSKQGTWLRDAMAASAACYKLVFFHHAPYSSEGTFVEPKMRWPFQAMGADAVFAGHEHVYERMEFNGIPYFVNGLGGANQFGWPNPPLPQTKVRFAGDWGAMRVIATDMAITYEFWTVGGKQVDTFTVPKSCGQSG